ncbi:MAG: magnesium transporter [bacterium]|nr:magnesium transporter [bacterium]
MSHTCIPKGKDKINNLLKRLIERGSPKECHMFLNKYHEADIADALEELDFEARLSFFQMVKPELAAEVLEEMIINQQIQLISDLKTELGARYIGEMEPDDAADLIEELLERDEEKAVEIIEALPAKEAEDIKELLSYKEDSAGAIMTSEFVSIPEKLSVEQALIRIKRQKPPDTEVSFYIFIVDENGALVGYTTLRNLVLSAQDTLVKDIRNDYPIKADINIDQEEVAKLFQKYNLIVMPVVDENNLLAGIVTVDDVVDVVVEEATEDIYKLSGTSEIDEYKLISGNPAYALKSRLPWLMVTISGGILASFIINIFSDLYKDQLFSLALSLSFVPLLMGLGGNVGNQSATIIVRGISTGFVKTGHPFRYIFRELRVGFLIGCIISIVVFIFNYLVNQPVIFSLIVSLAILGNITVAAFIGTCLPILFRKLRIDPAVASAPFISTTLDIVGQLIYFSMILVVVIFLLK